MKSTKLPQVRGVHIKGFMGATGAALALAALPDRMTSLNAMSLTELAGVTDEGLAKAAINVVRDNCKSLCACIDTTVDNLQDPLKTEFLSIKDRINKSLSTLQDTDKVPAANEANWVLRNLLSLFITSQQMMDHLQGMVKKQGADMQTAKNSLPDEVKKAIDAQVASGALVTKADNQTAIDNAIKQARKDWDAGISLLKTRQTALNSASIPLPGESVLALADADYQAKETQAKERFEKIKAFNLTADRVKVLCWDVDATSFEVTVEALSQKPAKPGSPDPFRSPNTPATKGVVCV